MVLFMTVRIPPENVTSHLSSKSFVNNSDGTQYIAFCLFTGIDEQEPDETPVTKNEQKDASSILIAEENFILKIRRSKMAPLLVAENYSHFKDLGQVNFS